MQLLLYYWLMGALSTTSFLEWFFKHKKKVYLVSLNEMNVQVIHRDSKLKSTTYFDIYYFKVILEKNFCDQKKKKNPME